MKQISDLYEKRRGVAEENERKAIYHQIDSISVLAAEYAVASNMKSNSGNHRDAGGV